MDMEHDAPIDPRYRIMRFWKHRIARPITDRYYRFRGSKPVMDFLMQGERKHYAEHPPELSGKEREIVDALSRDGIVITSLSELGLEHYLDDVRRFIETRKTASLGLKKQFLEYLWGERVDPFDPENPFNRLALEPSVLRIVEAYLTYKPLLYFTSANRTLPSTETQGSQKWHADPAAGDRRIVKLFLYVTDVKPENGPFEYVKHTSLSTNNPVIPLERTFRGVYPGDESVTPEIRAKHFVSAQGPAGTIVFCDTSGLHRGGFGDTGGRVMATAAYTSRFSIQGARFIDAARYRNTYQLK